MAPHRSLSRASLSLALRVNAAFSTFSAFALLLAADRLGPAMGVPPALLRAVGVGLAVFVVQLLVTAARRDPARQRREALRHAVADWAWVAATAVVLLGGWLTPFGQGLVAAVAVPVFVFGLWQLRALPPERPPMMAR